MLLPTHLGIRNTGKPDWLAYLYLSSTRLPNQPDPETVRLCLMAKRTSDLRHRIRIHSRATLHMRSVFHISRLVSVILESLMNLQVEIKYSKKSRTQIGSTELL